MSVAQSVRTRLPELDRLRGLAIVLMVGDHVAATILDGPLYRVTLGRLAMPLFFVLAGHLGRRLTGRHLVALGLGVALPVFAPFVDSPNVLVWWAAGSAVVYGFSRLGWPLWPILVVALTLGANGWGVHLGATSYDPLMLLALMVLGRLLPVGAFAAGRALPSWCEVLGRRPLAWYIGHVLALQAAMVAVGRG